MWYILQILNMANIIFSECSYNNSSHTIEYTSISLQPKSIQTVFLALYKMYLKFNLILKENLCKKLIISSDFAKLARSF